MATKTLTITEDSYNLLKNRKEENESFSQVITRILSRKKVTDYVGILSEKQATKLEFEIMESRKQWKNKQY